MNFDASKYVTGLIIVIASLIILFGIGTFVTFTKASGTLAFNQFLKTQGIGTVSVNDGDSFDCNNKMCIMGYVRYLYASDYPVVAIDRVNATEHKMVWNGYQQNLQDNDLSELYSIGVSCNTNHCYIAYYTDGSKPKKIRKIFSGEGIDFANPFNSWYDDELEITSATYSGTTGTISEIGASSLHCDDSYCYMLAEYGGGGGTTVIKIKLTSNGKFDHSYNIRGGAVGNDICTTKGVNDIQLDCNNKASCYAMCNTNYGAGPSSEGVYNINKNSMSSQHIGNFLAYVEYNAENVLKALPTERRQPTIKCTNFGCYTFQIYQEYYGFDTDQISYFEQDSNLLSLDTEFNNIKKTHDIVQKGLDVDFLPYVVFAHCEYTIDEKTKVPNYGNYCYVPGIYDPGVTETFSEREFGIVTIFGDTGQVNHLTKYSFIDELSTDDLRGFNCVEKYCYMLIGQTLWKFSKNNL